MFNNKKIKELEEELKEFGERVKLLEDGNEKLWGGWGSEKGVGEFSITFTFHAGLWDKLMNYLGIEYFEEEKSSFRKVRK